jgi:Ubiquitin carboxyl-terminal hydrolase
MPSVKVLLASVIILGVVLGALLVYLSWDKLFKSGKEGKGSSSTNGENDSWKPVGLPQNVNTCYAAAVIQSLVRLEEIQFCIKIDAHPVDLNLAQYLCDLQQAMISNNESKSKELFMEFKEKIGGNFFTNEQMGARDLLNEITNRVGPFSFGPKEIHELILAQPDLITFPNDVEFPQFITDLSYYYTEWPTVVGFVVQNNKQLPNIFIQCNSQSEYKVKSVITRSGSDSDNGHYTAKVKIEDTWWNFNDDWVTKIDGEFKINEEAVIVFYEATDAVVVPMLGVAEFVPGISDLVRSVGQKIIQVPRNIEQPIDLTVIDELVRLGNEINVNQEQIRNIIQMKPNGINPDSILSWQTMVLLPVNFCQLAIESISRRANNLESVTRSVLCAFQVIGYKLPASQEIALRQLQVKLMRKLQALGHIPGYVLVDGRQANPDSIRDITEMAALTGLAPIGQPAMTVFFQPLGLIDRNDSGDIVNMRRSRISQHIFAEVRRDIYNDAVWPDFLLVKFEKHDLDKVPVTVNPMEEFRGQTYKLVLISGHSLTSREKLVIKETSNDHLENRWTHISKEQGIVNKEARDDISPAWLLYTKQEDQRDGDEEIVFV